MNVEYLDIDPIFEETSALILQSKNSSLSHKESQIYDKGMQRIKVQKKNLRIILFTLMYVLVLSMIYNSMLFMGILRPRVFI